MPFLECQQRLYPLRQGENRIGQGANVNVRLSALPLTDQLAIGVERVGCFAWTAGNVEGVSINGKPLSGEPIPLFHGDRICVNGTTLQFVDDESRASTLDVPLPTSASFDRTKAALDRGPLNWQTPPLQQRKVVAVLRHLSSDQAYVIGNTDFRIGREKRCDLIIPDPFVSRFQAEISVAQGQYMLRQIGRAATKVNGSKLCEPRALKPGDLINIAGHEYAFSRRPPTAEEIVGSVEVTPIGGDVPHAPTVRHGHSLSSPVFNWILVAATIALAALVLF
ncbi:MAG: FHA domain-containing protein [Gemmatimonadota bacterium]|nr:MAG: FHA domain-containing protein [Gemmatimonadota bacterium]